MRDCVRSGISISTTSKGDAALVEGIERGCKLADSEACSAIAVGDPPLSVIGNPPVAKYLSLKDWRPPTGTELSAFAAYEAERRARRRERRSRDTISRDSGSASGDNGVPLARLQRYLHGSRPVAVRVGFPTPYRGST